MGEFKILFTADLHGNKLQYEKLFKKAMEEKASALILGGDITPKDMHQRTVADQRKFLESYFLPRVKRFLEASKEYECKVFVMMGNDDFKDNEFLLKKFASKNKRLVVLHNKFAKLSKNFKIFGYPFVPPTPFKYKDWEKLDTGAEADSIRKPFFLDGIKNKGTIKDDLKKIESRVTRNTVLIVHTPPYGTALDMTKGAHHVGSIALRKFLERNKCCISLHGHIHETVEVSGKFKDVVGGNICVSAGNDNLSDSIAIIKFDLQKANGAQREII